MNTAADTAAPIAVHLHAARLSYRGVVIFEDLDLDLPAGRITCLLGPSGVGKTSLLRLIAGLTGNDGGDGGGGGGGGDAGDGGDGGGTVLPGTAVDQAGRAVQDRVAYMAQQDLLLPWASVLGNVLLGPRLRGEDRDPDIVQRARGLIAQVGLKGREEVLPARLSGGMRQRVALARTLVENRPIVLMDEPFSALDAITRFALQELAARLLAEHTVLLVTHDPLEALRLGHRIYVMAGSPARLETALDVLDDVGGADELPAPPRDPGNADVLARQADLLKRLARARENVLDLT
jgi:putative hydroxymethylpyrimidine transport system ATP-binding protein